MILSDLTQGTTEVPKLLPGYPMANLTLFSNNS